MGNLEMVEPTSELVCIGIADIRIGISSSDPNLRIGLDEDMRAFSAPLDSPDLSLETYWRTLEDAGCGGQKLFDSGGTWQLYFKDNAYWFYCTAPAFGTIPYKVARIAHDFSNGQVFLNRPFFRIEQAVYPLQYPLDELLLLNLLSRGRGVEVHACGIVDSTGDGYLFVGHSGSGKTTMARFWEKEPGVTILSDDRVILKHEQGQIWMYGTPWHGEAELASASRAPLKHIFFICHGQRNSLKPKTGAEAAALLFSSSFPVFYCPEALEFTIEFYGKVANQVPCSELSVVPNPEIIDFIRRQPS